MKKNVIKEIIIVLLLALAIILILGVLLYEFVPANKIIPETSQKTISSIIVIKSGVLYVRRKILKKSKRKPIIKPIRINARNILNSVYII